MLVRRRVWICDRTGTLDSVFVRHLQRACCRMQGVLRAQLDFGRQASVEQPELIDYVLSKGEVHSVCELAEPSFHEVGIKIEWPGSDLEEKSSPANADAKLIWGHRTYVKHFVRDTLASDLEMIQNRNAFAFRS